MLSLKQTGDQAFVFLVYASTRLDELALVDWSLEQKEAFLRMQFDLRDRQYRQAFPGSVTEMILSDDQPAGMLMTHETESCLYLVDLALLPEFRGAGLGTQILQNLQKKMKPITLHVLRQNPAVHLYSRLGFITTTEDAIYQQMEWKPL